MGQKISKLIYIYIYMYNMPVKIHNSYKTVHPKICLYETYTMTSMSTKTAMALGLVRNLLGRHNSWLTKTEMKVVNSGPGHTPAHLHT